MPGKHAPTSSRSFLISLGAAVGGALAALAVVVGIAVVVLNAGSDKNPGGAIVVRPTPSDTPAVTPSPSAAPSETPSPTPSASAGVTTSPSEVTLRVLNGTGRAGLAAAMSKRAQDEGYPAAKLGNAARTPKSTIYYRADAREEAEAFQQTFPEFTEIAAAPSSFATDVMLTLVLGEDYSSPSPSPSA